MSNNLTVAIIRKTFFLGADGKLNDNSTGKPTRCGPRDVVLRHRNHDYTRQHLEDFLRRHERANNAAIRVAGILGVESVKSAVEALGAERIFNLPFHKLQALLGFLEYHEVVHAEKLRNS